MVLENIESIRPTYGFWTRRYRSVRLGNIGRKVQKLPSEEKSGRKLSNFEFWQRNQNFRMVISTHSMRQKSKISKNQKHSWNSLGSAAWSEALNPPHLVRGSSACWTMVQILCIDRRAKPPPPSAGPASAADLSHLPPLTAPSRHLGSLGCTLGPLWASYDLTLEQKSSQTLVNWKTFRKSTAMIPSKTSKSILLPY